MQHRRSSHDRRKRRRPPPNGDHRKVVPRCSRAGQRGLRVARGRDPRPPGAERCRQVDPDQDSVRRRADGFGYRLHKRHAHDDPLAHSRAGARHLHGLSGVRADPPAHRGGEHPPRAPRPETRHRRLDQHVSACHGDSRSAGVRHQRPRAGRPFVRPRAAGRRDCARACSRREDPGPGRADRCPHRSGDRASVRDSPGPARSGRRNHLHLAQPGGGRAHRRPRNRAARRANRGDRRSADDLGR